MVRIKTDFQNASSIVTDGIDVSMSYDWNMGGLGDWRVAFNGSHIIQYNFDGPGVKGDLANSANNGNSVYELPKIKFNARVEWAPDDLNRASIVWTHVAPFEDDRTATGGRGPGKISQSNRFDLVYARQMESYPVDVTLAIQNVFDQDPPFALRDLNYLPRIHDGIGRRFLASMVYRWEE